jgi:predicted DNA-binding protein YlxM (UPF0122 family)
VAVEIFEPDYLSFVTWQATPREFIDDLENYPATMQEFADKIGVSRKCLYDWQKKPGHWERVKDIYDKLHLRKSLEVRNALYKRTQGVTVTGGYDKDGVEVFKDLPPDPKAIELWLKYEDKWNDKIGVEMSGDVNVNVKAEVCAATFEAAKKELIEKGLTLDDNTADKTAK